MDGAYAQATASSSTRPATLLASPFTDQITPVGPTPYGSRPASMPGSASGFSAPGLNVPQSYFHSRRVRPGEVQQPWKDKKDPKEKWVTIIPCIGLFFGLAIAGFLVWHGLRSVVNHKYCPVLMENWSNGFDEKIWTREVECGGFGNGQFDYTTNSEENSYVKDGHLHIRPTLQDEKLITIDNVMNLTEMGICTSPVLKNCVSGTNSTNGTIINPVKSARINSRKGAKIKYGRVEVSARFPEGKWLWPAIWMLPVEEKYGAWPASGEMDIAESRGNDWKYPQGGNDIISSTLHWGPDPANDAWWRTNVKHRASHTSYSSSFHTFGIEWSEKYIFTYVDSRLLQVLFTNFQTRLWERGNFPLANENGTKYIDTWSQTGRESTPFDQEFYLIINLGVGATSGWFEDGKDKKPWVDGSHSAAKDFWDSRKEWKETWKNDGEMVVKSVKMWQQCD